MAYVLWMQQGGFPATKSQVEAAALTLRRRRDPDALPLSKNWYGRWPEAHPYLRKTTIRAVEQDRKSFESTNIADVEKFFSRLDNLTKKHRIDASDIWNADEFGIRIVYMAVNDEVMEVGGGNDNISEASTLYS